MTFSFREYRQGYGTGLTDDEVRAEARQRLLEISGRWHQAACFDMFPAAADRLGKDAVGLLAVGGQGSATRNQIVCNRDVSAASANAACLDALVSSTEGTSTTKGCSAA